MDALDGGGARRPVSDANDELNPRVQANGFALREEYMYCPPKFYTDEDCHKIPNRRIKCDYCVDIDFMHH